jgi:predicted  nucleic acid-binding Zn-ribbon protein
MHEPTEALAAELEWAASGAAREIDALRQRVDALQRTCDERNAVIADLRAGMEQLREIADERASAIATLDAALTAAQVSLAAAAAEHRAEHERVAVLRREYEAELDAARRHGAVLRGRLEQGENDLRFRAIADELQRVCDERLALIEQISTEMDSLRAVAEERAALLAANEAAFRAREAELIAEGDRRTALLADLTAAFENKVREIETLRGGIPRSA